MDCDFDKIWLLLEKKLGIEEQLELLEHLKNCDICFETARTIRRDRDSRLHVPRNVKEEAAS